MSVKVCVNVAKLEFFGDKAWAPFEVVGQRELCDIYLDNVVSDVPLGKILKTVKEVSERFSMLTERNTEIQWVSKNHWALVHIRTGAVVMYLYEQ